MPTLHSIVDHYRARLAAGTAADVAEILTFDRHHPADEQMAEATDAYARLYARLAGGLQAPVLSDADAVEFQKARHTVLKAIGCTFPFPAPRAGYTNMLSFVKQGFVVRLTHDALPIREGLPNAGRIAAMAILRYVNGEARGHVAAFAEGKWNVPVTDEAVQRMIDEIAAAIG